MDLIALPAFVDNYIWMVHEGREAWVVDPGDAAPVLEAIGSRGLQLVGILVTHHHGDHVGGLSVLKPHLRGPIVAPALEDIPGATRLVRDGDRVEVLGRRFEVIAVPGHTAGHVAYFHAPEPEPERSGPDQPILFCGDTLFSAGCGRLFEGTPAQMHESLARLSALPGDTAVCCAHEYTVANLRFALAVEPGNARIREHLARCRTLREQNVPTVPSSIALERDINPFLRCHVEAVVHAAMQRRPDLVGEVDVLRTLREWKNDFR